jgi:prophage antirepressor-like protein
MEHIVNEFKYKNNMITMITDDDNNLWFNGYQTCIILGYNDPKNIIRKLVHKRHIKYLKDIMKDYKLYPRAQPHSIYIHEAGLYTLMIRSKKPNAEKFLLWITEDVIPSIRKNGYYKANSDIINQFKKLEKLAKQREKKLKEELKEKDLKIMTLENNQKNKHICSKGKYIYILKSALEDYINEDSPDTLKIGKTRKYKIRMSTYNTGQKDNTIVLYRAKVDDLSAVDNCLKGLLSKKVYRTLKEYYDVTLREAIRTVKKCIKLTGSKLLFEDNFYHKYKLTDTTKLKGFNYGMDNTKCDITDQKGGSNNRIIKSYNYYSKSYKLYNKLMDIIRSS